MPHMNTRMQSGDSRASAEATLRKVGVLKSMPPSGGASDPDVKSRRALAHVYPQWEPPADDPGAPTDEYREVWRGQMRIVRNRRRIRKLQRRGVPMMDVRARNAAGYRGPRCMAWFVEQPPVKAVP